MRKITWLYTLALLLVCNTVWAAPGNYHNFLQTLDEIELKSVLPIKDLPAVNMPSGVSTQLVAAAKGTLGLPVIWGGSSPSGFDCSGLVQYLFRQVGVIMPRTADLQFKQGRMVSRGELQPGDLVYFTTYEPGASHVGVYIGQDNFIHTSFAEGKVTIGSINDAYFAARYYGAKRI